MLSISPPMSAGQGQYYTELAREDYYLENGGEPPGVWLGRGAKKLGLSGKVDSDCFRAVFDGFDIDGQKLVQNAGEENRQAGWDLSFSAPKSVSTVWSQAPLELRRAIQEAHFGAVATSLSYLETAAGFGRSGARGAWESAELAFAVFEHGTSRALDPQLHSHAICMNVGVKEDGRTGAIVSSELFRHKMAAGALYRAELAFRLGRLGFEIDRERSWFEIAGTPKPLIDEFSKRREQILDHQDLYGAGSARSAAISALETREAKECLPRAELFEQWRAVGRSVQFGEAEVLRLVSLDLSDREEPVEVAAAVSTAVETITHTQSHFSARDLVRRVAEEAQGSGLSAETVLGAVAEQLASDAVVELSEVRGELRYSTPEVLELERELLGRIDEAKEIQQSVSEQALANALGKASDEKGYLLSDEQLLALRHVALTSERVACVYGMAGTGKSSLLYAAREAWESSGLTVYGASLSGKAAAGLEESSGISCRTLHQTLAQLERGRLELGKDTVLVLDEAGMVGTRQMAELVRRCDDAGAKLVLAGDWKQLQAIEAGGPFRAIAEKTGYCELTDIRRQDAEWMRVAVTLFSEGEATQALSLFSERELLKVSETRKHSIADLLEDWTVDGVEKPEENLILVPTNLEAQQMNRYAQAARAGELGEKSAAVGGDRVFEGDRVLFTKNSNALGVSNGMLATVTSLGKNSNSLLARIDGEGRLVSIPLDHYSDIKLGYAVTTHKSQGTTVQNSFILAGGPMQDRELSYVQASRARGTARFYTDKVEAGEDLEQLERQMALSREKDLALEHTQNR